MELAGPVGQQETFSYQDLFLDFEQELADILRTDTRRAETTEVPAAGTGSEGIQVRRRSTSGFDYENDGTIACAALNYDVLVSFSWKFFFENI